MKYIKIRDSKGNNRFVRLYSTKRSKNVVAVKTTENEILYAGSGTSISGPAVMKVQTAAGAQDVCEYADDIPNLKLIAEYSTTQDVTLSKDLFPLGGKVTCYGEPGVSSYGAGGRGSSDSMYFGALLSDTVLHVTIGVNNGSAGTAGTNTTHRSFRCSSQSTSPYHTCYQYYPTSTNATAGGAGGRGTRAKLDLTGQTINAYGGGGGGGGRGSLSYYRSCPGPGAGMNNGCGDMSVYLETAYGSFGSGGAAGNGAAGSGVNGGSAGSDTGAVVRVFAFTE